MKQLKKLSFDHVLSDEELKQIKGGLTACHCSCLTGVGTWIAYYKSDDVDCHNIDDSPWCEKAANNMANVMCTKIALV